MKIQAEIEVPDEVTGCDGSVFVPTGEIRTPQRGDCFLTSDSKIAEESVDISSPNIYYKRAIYRKKQWRASEGITYYFIDCNLCISASCDTSTELDDHLFEVGNYFEHKSDAELCAERMDNALVDFRREAGL